MRRVKGLDKHGNSNNKQGRNRKKKTRKQLQKAEILLARCLVFECWGGGREGSHESTGTTDME